MLRAALSTPQAQGNPSGQCLICASGKTSSWLASCTSGQTVRVPSFLPDTGLVQVSELTTTTYCLSLAGSFESRNMAQPDNSAPIRGRQNRTFISVTRANNSCRLTEAAAPWREKKTGLASRFFLVLGT